MESSVKFSILVPVYKVEEYIRECIESVLNQTYQNFELILVNDGSPDKSGEICEEYAKKDARVKVFHKENSGAVETRCLAVEKASGDYYIIIDSDDYLALNALEILAANIEKYDADCIIYGLSWLKPDGTEELRCKEEYSGRLITDKRYALNIILNDGSYNALWRKCVKAKCLGNRDFSPYYFVPNGNDLLYSTEILETADSFLFLADCLYFYRVNPGGITKNKKYDNYKADFTVEKQVHEMLERCGVFSADDYDRMRNFDLDATVVELKRISRFCSSHEHSVASMKRLWESSYYTEFLKAGYKKVPSLPGVTEVGGVRRMMNSIVLFLFRHRFFSLTVFFNKYIYK